MIRYETMSYDQGCYSLIVYDREEAIKILINFKNEKSCANMCEAYIRHVKIKDNPAKGMAGTFFVNDFDGERILGSRKPPRKNDIQLVNN